MLRSKLACAGTLPARACLLATFAVLAPLAAQDPAPHTLTDVATAMRALPGVAFKTFEEQDQAMIRRFRRMMPQEARETELSGRTAGELLVASVFDGEHEVVLSGARMIARVADGEWRARRGVTVDGRPLPFLFDPALFFERLADVVESGKDERREETTWREKPWQIVTVTFDEEAARDLVLGGAVPRVGGGMRGAIMIGGPALGGDDPPEITLDVALWIDPQTGLCHRMKASAYEVSDVPDNVHIQIEGDAGEADDAGEKVKELDADGKRIYKGGLPVRAIDSSTSAMHFEVELSAHGATEAPKLDATALARLGATGGK